jgi:hypothetical protein
MRWNLHRAWSFNADAQWLRYGNAMNRISGCSAASAIAMNTRTANSQLMGGMIWGISSALHEATEIDIKRARY